LVVFPLSLASDPTWVTGKHCFQCISFGFKDRMSPRPLELSVDIKTINPRQGYLWFRIFQPASCPHLEAIITPLSNLIGNNVQLSVRTDQQSEHHEVQVLRVSLFKYTYDTTTTLLTIWIQWSRTWKFSTGFVASELEHASSRFCCTNWAYKGNIMLI
jgi:hypothetical protein